MSDSQKAIKMFGTDGIRGRVGDVKINPEFMLKLGWAVGQVLKRHFHKPKVIIGKDTRISGYMFESALEAGFSAAGVDICLLGPMPTSAISYLVKTFRAQAGVVISASHNPYHDNGVKFFSSQGTKLPESLEKEIEEELHSHLETVDSSELGKAVRIDDAAGRYIEFCKSTVPTHVSFEGLRLVIDCANGATYHVAPSIFRELGAEVFDLNVSPDGLNINEYCGSTNPDFLRKIVLAEEADMGIAFDGDGDRVIMVDHTGEIVDGDDILYVMAKYALAKKQQFGGVVGTIMSNFGLEKTLQNLGVEFARTNVGDRFVYEGMLNHGWLIGGEPSGHIICLDSSSTGDGIISALRVLTATVELGRNLHDIRSELVKYPQKLVNVKVNNLVDPMTKTVVCEEVARVEKELHGAGRVLLRMSGTEPLVRVMVEAEIGCDVDQYVDHLAKVVEEALS